jgi:hypothetical protein
MMGDQKFLRSLLEFDKDSLGDKQVCEHRTSLLQFNVFTAFWIYSRFFIMFQVNQVAKYMKDPKFNPTDLMSISKAAAGLLKYIIAIFV